MKKRNKEYVTFDGFPDRSGDSLSKRQEKQWKKIEKDAEKYPNTTEYGPDGKPKKSFWSKFDPSSHVGKDGKIENEKLHMEAVKNKALVEGALSKVLGGVGDYQDSKLRAEQLGAWQGLDKVEKRPERRSLFSLLQQAELAPSRDAEQRLVREMARNPEKFYGKSDKK